MAQGEVLKEVSKELLPVPDLPEGKPLTPAEFRPFDNEPMPAFGNETADNIKDRQVTAVDKSRLTAKIMTKLFFNMNLDKGRSAVTGNLTGGCILLPPNSNALAHAMTNLSTGSTWHCYVEFSQRQGESLVLSSIQAYADVATPFCTAAVKYTKENQSVDYSKTVKYSMVQKYTAPIGSFSFIPHYQIKVDDTDPGTCTIMVSKEFIDAAKQTIDSINLSDSLTKVTAALKGLFDYYGHMYPQEFSFGVGAYQIKNSVAETEEQRKELSSQFSVGGNGLMVTGETSIDGTNRDKVESIIRVSSESWNFIGIAGQHDSPVDAVLEHRLDPKQWAIISVTKWGSVLELLPAEMRRKMDELSKRFPDFLWQRDYDTEKRYMLRNVSNSQLLTRYPRRKYISEYHAEYDAGIPRTPFNNIVNESWVDYVLTWGDPKIELSGFLLEQFYRATHIYKVTQEDHSWLFVKQPEWGSKVALKNCWNIEAGRFLTVSKEDVDGKETFVPRFTEKKDLSTIGENELFEVTVSIHDSIQIVWEKDQTRRYLRQVPYRKINASDFPNKKLEDPKEVSHKFLYYHYVTTYECYDWSTADGSYHVEFTPGLMDNESALWKME